MEICLLVHVPDCNMKTVDFISIMADHLYLFMALIFPTQMHSSIGGFNIFVIKLK